MRMSKQLIILLLFLVGFFTFPTESFACGNGATQPEMSCCQKEAKETSKDSSDCCQKNDSNDHENEDCQGDCENCNCFPDNSATSFLLHDSFTILSDIKKEKQFYTEGNFPSVILSIWEPPKIS